MAGRGARCRRDEIAGRGSPGGPTGRPAHQVWDAKESQLAHWEATGRYNAEEVELPMPLRPMLPAVVASAAVLAPLVYALTSLLGC